MGVLKKWSDTEEWHAQDLNIPTEQKEVWEFLSRFGCINFYLTKTTLVKDVTMGTEETFYNMVKDKTFYYIVKDNEEKQCIHACAISDNVFVQQKTQV